MYFVYLLRCTNQSLYCGYTTDLKRRVYEHLFAKTGAKYTKRFRPSSIAAAWQVEEDMSLAMKIEWAIKKLSKADKEALICHMKLQSILGQMEIEQSVIALTRQETKDMWRQAMALNKEKACL